MKNFPISIFHIIFSFSILIILILILFPFNLINLEQAQRVAQWKSVYENLKYSFDLVMLHENSIIPNQNEADKVITDEYIILRLLPYFNGDSDRFINPYKFRYKRLNGSHVVKNSHLYFENFIELKNNILISIKTNPEYGKNKKEPPYIMFIDINSKQKPNRIGQDIFFINIFNDKITPMGEGKSHASLKGNCSPIGNGIYCSKYYLLGGRF